MSASSQAVESVAVYICTHKRNKPLHRLLETLSVAAEVVQPEVEIAAVVVDDNPDGRAKEVVDNFEGPFLRGLHYRFSGSQNISIARNIGVEAALEYADWVAMVDDDQVVVPEWLDALIGTCIACDADAVTGPVHIRYPLGSPSWLSDEPFSEILEAGQKQEGAAVELCSTGNSLVSGEFLKANPEIRFREELGTVGGEDMVFFREASAAGLRAHYSVSAVSFAEQPPDRSNFRHQMRSCFWIGNTEFVSNVEGGGSGRPRMFFRGSKRALGYLARPLQRLVHRQSPQWRFALGGLAQSLGIYAGIVGIKVPHR